MAPRNRRNRVVAVESGRYTFGVQLAPTPRAPRMSRSGLIVLVYGALGAIAILWSVLRGHPDLYRSAASTPARLAASPVVGLAIGLGLVFLSRCAVHRMEWARVLHREFHAVVHELSSREIFLLAVSSSVGEELFFRGAMLPALGLWPSSALFALMHVRAQWRFLPWTIMSFIMGVAMG